MLKEFKSQLPKFQELGLTERESKVYITLLSKKAFTSSELQKTAGIPRTKIYEVLFKLIDKGICVERRAGKVKYYEAVEPKKALHKMLEDYKAGYQREIEKKSELTENLTRLFNPVFEKNKSLDNPLEFVEVVKDKDQAQKRILDAFRSAKSEVLSMVKGPYVCDTNMRANQQFIEERHMLKRGVRSRKIYESHELDEAAVIIDQFKSLSKIGAQLKATDTVPIKMVVFDERLVIFPLQDTVGNPNELTIISIEHKEMVHACRILFDFLWSNASPLKN
ncbi:MAG: hypothetical protein LWX07_11190 [Bacteroidetes bacterium]|nr:hypothetical protein [Bacteroidota bacterium]